MQTGDHRQSQRLGDCSSTLQFEAAVANPDGLASVVNPQFDAILSRSVPRPTRVDVPLSGCAQWVSTLLHLRGRQLNLGGDAAMLTLPPLLDILLAEGRWPRTDQEQLAQSLRPYVSPERVRAVVPDEQGSLYLYKPPFAPVGRRTDPQDFFNWPSSDPAGIDYDLAIMIGDFGLGSDAPIALDYRNDLANPRVMRLRYNPDSPPLVGKWIVMTPDFPSFVSALGL